MPCSLLPCKNVEGSPSAAALLVLVLDDPSSSSWMLMFIMFSWWSLMHTGAACSPVTSLSLPFSGLIVYLGMMVGAFVWGGLADKLGRRRCLVSALNMHCAFAFLSSFAQGYGSFLFFRLFSGIGWGNGWGAAHRHDDGPFWCLKATCLGN